MEDRFKAMELRLDNKDKEVEDLQKKLSEVSLFYFHYIIISLSLLDSLDYPIYSATATSDTFGSSPRQDPQDHQLYFIMERSFQHELI